MQSGLSGKWLTSNNLLLFFSFFNVFNYIMGQKLFFFTIQLRKNASRKPMTLCDLACNKMHPATIFFCEKNKKVKQNTTILIMHRRMSVMQQIHIIYVASVGLDTLQPEEKETHNFGCGSASNVAARFYSFYRE